MIPDFAQFMSGPGWAVFSVFGAFFAAGIHLVNQYFKAPGHMLVFWSRLAIVLMMTPLISQIDLPADWRFYAAVAVTVLAGSVSDIRTFNVSAKYGGGVVSRVQPLIVWGSFLIWFLFDPHLFAVYADHPLNTFGILAALGGCVYFAQRLNRCQITKSAFIEMLPALIGYIISSVFNKYAMDHGGKYATGHGGLHGAVFGYMYVQSFLAVCLLGPYAALQERKARARSPAPKSWMTKGMIVSSLVMAIAWILHMTFKNYAMAFTVNPAYQAALNLTAPVFIALFYFLTKHKEEADVRSGFGIVACAVLLVVFTVK